MMDLQTILKSAVEQKTADIFILAGLPVSFKVNGKIVPQSDEKVLPKASEALIREMYQMANREIEKLLESGDDDFALSIPGIARFRASTYKQRGSLAAVIRVVAFEIPDFAAMNIPEEVMVVAKETNGLVLVTGPAGSGKSTTLACILDRINNTRNGHIITLEEPIEYLYRNKMSAVSQREIEVDSDNYVTALRACLRQAPDVILVGEMRDYETIKTAMTAAETGHLVISTLHTVGAANTIDRVIDVFPPNQQQQIRVQISMLLQTVISQQLIPTVDDKLIPVFEIMHVNGAIRNMIRESKIHQIDTVIASSAGEGMVSMDSSILDYVKKGVISKENALKFCSNGDLMAKKLSAL